MRILDSVKTPIQDYLEVHLHVGTASVLANVAMLESIEMAGGQKQMVQLRLSEPLSVVPGERFVVRANLPMPGQIGLSTLGGGRIVGASNARLRRKKSWTLAALAARRDALDDAERWCALMLRESTEPVSETDLQRKCLLRLDETARVIERLRAAGLALRTPTGSFLHRDVVQETAARILAAVHAFHTANPQRAGLTREELLPLADGNAELFRLAADALVTAKQIEHIGTVFARGGWSARLSDHDQQLSDKITAAMKVAGWTSPALADLAMTVREPVERVEKMVRLLTERAVLVRLDERVFMHCEAVEAAQQVALRLFASRPSFSTMEFRDALAVSRKYAVPLLDHLDRIRFTVRSGHDRTPGVEARKRMK
jgi:selenocysteine-specific elongation factor